MRCTYFPNYYYFKKKALCTFSIFVGEEEVHEELFGGPQRLPPLVLVVLRKERRPVRLLERNHLLVYVAQPQQDVRRVVLGRRVGGWFGDAAFFLFLVLVVFHLFQFELFLGLFVGDIWDEDSFECEDEGGDELAVLEEGERKGEPFLEAWEIIFPETACYSARKKVV